MKKQLNEIIEGGVQQGAAPGLVAIVVDRAGVLGKVQLASEWLILASP